MKISIIRGNPYRLMWEGAVGLRVLDGPNPDKIPITYRELLHRNCDQLVLTGYADLCTRTGDHEKCRRITSAAACGRSEMPAEVVWCSCWCHRIDLPVV